MIFLPQGILQQQIVASGYLVQDTFTDSNGTKLGDGTGGTHAPDIDVVGGGWIEIPDGASFTGMEIQSNRAVNDSAAPTGYFSEAIETNASDVQIDTVLSVGNGASGFVMFRGDGTVNNHWIGGLSESRDATEIWENNGKSFTNRDTTGWNIVGGTQYDLQLILNGTDVSVTADGINEASYGSATHTQTETQHGYRLEGSTCTADDFTVTAL